MDGRQRDRDEPVDYDLNAWPAEEPPHPTFENPPIAVWRPEPGAGQVIGLVLLLVTLGFLVVAFRQVGDSDGISRAFWLAVGLLALSGTALTSLLIARLRSIRYTLDPSRLVVSAVGRRMEISFQDIEEVVFRPRDRVDVDGWERYWPGFFEGETMTSEGRWRSLATAPPSERVRIRLREGLTVAISPDRPVLFVEALESYRRGVPPEDLGRRIQEPPPEPTMVPITEELVSGRPNGEPSAPRHDLPQQRLRSWRPMAYIIFRRRIVQGDQVASNLLALSVLTLIGLVFIAAWKSDSVNQPVAVHWDAQGEPSRYVRPGGIWIIEGIWIYPATAAAVVAVNAALATLAAAFDRMREARLLLSASFLVSLLFVAAVAQTTGIV